MKTFLALFCLFVSISSRGQIMVSGYKCFYPEGFWPNRSADLYNSHDTFKLEVLLMDIDADLDDAGVTDTGKMGEANTLKYGLRECFGTHHYHMTNDSLYVGSYKYWSVNTYIYKVYIPERQASLSIRSSKNDAVFFQKSKWLLKQIRIHRKKEIYLINEKGKTCQCYPVEDC